MEQQLLTIAIPTYNRRKYLEENLNVLLPQLEKNDNVEVFVSDNASTDDTESFMKKICEKYPIKYYRNEVNVGADGNFCRCFERAEGKYILILSDDDILKDHSLQYLTQLLKKEPDFLFLNCSSFEGRYVSANRKNGAIRLEEDWHTEDAGELLAKIGIHITFVSALCYKMELVKRIDNLEQYCNTNFLQSYIAFAIMGMKPKEQLYVSARPLIAARGGNTGGYGLYETWFQSYYNLLQSAKKLAGISDDVIKRVSYLSYKNTIFNFVRIFRLHHNTMDMKQKNIVWKVMKHYPGLWAKTIFWVYTPTKVLQFFRKTKMRFSGLVN